MNLDLRQCEALRAVVEGGSFEQAAVALRLTPSAVSQRLRALEQRLGAPLVVRSRPCRATPAGQRVLRHLRRMQAIERELADEFAGIEAAPLAVPIALNNDSLASWFLPALAPFLLREQVLLELMLADQDHTYAMLEGGLALGCVSTEARPMRGCTATLLGVMRYRCMAAPAFRARWFAHGFTRAALRRAPVLVFDRRDRLQADFLLRHYGLGDGAYPCHYVPASAPYLQAIELGLGWGMLPEQQMEKQWAAGTLVDLAPQRAVDVALYWHAWQVQAPRMEKLSETLIEAARAVLQF